MVDYTPHDVKTHNNCPNAAQRDTFGSAHGAYCATVQYSGLFAQVTAKAAIFASWMLLVC